MYSAIPLNTSSLKDFGVATHKSYTILLIKVKRISVYNKRILKVYLLIHGHSFNLGLFIRQKIDAIEHFSQLCKVLFKIDSLFLET